MFYRASKQYQWWHPILQLLIYASVLFERPFERNTTGYKYDVKRLIMLLGLNALIFGCQQGMNRVLGP
jgi:hypothetical protein